MKNFWKRHCDAMTHRNAFYLALKGEVCGSNVNFCGLFPVLNRTAQRGILKTFRDLGSKYAMEAAFVGKRFRHYPREDV